MLALRKLTQNALKTSPIAYNAVRFAAGSISSGPEPGPAPFIPSSAHYDELINFAGRNRDFVSVQQLLNKRVKESCFNTTNTFKFVSADLSILDDLLETLAVLDKGFARKGAYDALIARLSKLQHTAEALRVAEEMVTKGYGANSCTFHPILNALTRKREMEEAWRVIELMREHKIEPDITAYNYLLTAYCFVGDLMSAAGVVTKMREEGMAADTRTYDALVLGACRSGKVEGALMVLRRMVDEGVAVLYSTHAHVINAMCRQGYYAQAIEFVTSYAGKDKNLDSENFGVLATRLINLKRLDEARIVVGDMKKRGLPMGERLKDFYELHFCTN